MDIFDLDEFILARVVDHLGGPYFAGPLRATCRKMRARICEPHHCNAYSLLMDGAYRGSREECELAISNIEKSKCESQYIAWHAFEMVHSAVRGATRAHRASSFPPIVLALEHGINPADIIKSAAVNGNDKLCSELREMIETAQGHVNADKILAHAARGGHISTCKLAMSWGARDFDAMLREGALGGNIAVCEFAISLGARDFEGMNREASRLIFASTLRHNGDAAGIEICKRARELGARNFEEVLQNAAAEGSIALCKLAMSWGARDFDAMLRAIAKNLSESAREIMVLAISSGARDVEGLFARAICECNFKVAWYALREFGARDFRRALAEYSLVPYENRVHVLNVFAAIRDMMESVHHEDPGIWNIMLAEAARRGYWDLCELAHEWGARDYSSMKREAIERSEREIQRLIRDWEHEESRELPITTCNFTCVVM